MITEGREMDPPTPWSCGRQWLGFLGESARSSDGLEHRISTPNVEGSSPSGCATIANEGLI